MCKQTKTVIHDAELQIEAYRFRGMTRPFPSHFHAYYVFGLVEKGTRRLTCRNQEFAIRPGDVLLFQPGDSHGCTQMDGGTLDYRGLNLSQEGMQAWTEEITGRRTLPGFTQTVIREEETACYLRRLHQGILSGAPEFDREEALLLFLTRLLQDYGQPVEAAVPECRAEVELACAFLERNYAQRITLDQICRCAGLSKSTLLRAFTQAKGITPYRYLEAVRIGVAKKLLEQGVSPVEAALRTGFSDQSHLTNYFSRFLGLAPGAYQAMFRRVEEEGGQTHGA